MPTKPPIPHDRTQYSHFMDTRAKNTPIKMGLMSSSGQDTGVSECNRWLPCKDRVTSFKDPTACTASLVHRARRMPIGSLTRHIHDQDQSADRRYRPAAIKRNVAVDTNVS